MDPSLLIAEIMTVSPITIKPSTTIDIIRDIFAENKFHHLPVLENGNVVGIISKIDMLIYFKELSDETIGKKYTMLSNYFTNASDIMTTDLVKLETTDTIGLAADIFMANILHCIPIVDGKLFVGILTSHDLIKYAFKEAIINVEN